MDRFSERLGGLVELKYGRAVGAGRSRRQGALPGPGGAFRRAGECTTQWVGCHFYGSDGTQEITTYVNHTFGSLSQGVPSLTLLEPP